MFIVFGLVGFALVIPILACLRGIAFQTHPGDSASRMIMHVVPLLILSILFASGEALRGLDDRSEVDHVDSDARSRITSD